MQETLHAASMPTPAEQAGQVFSLIQPELAGIERGFKQQLSSNVQIIENIGKYLSESGGKRIRPALLILASKLSGSAQPQSVTALGVVMEMIHTATLVHDDIIDRAEIRRGRPSTNARWGNEIAVLMGDWLYMTAFSMTLAERNLEILGILTTLTRLMTEGELQQLELRGRSDITEEQHFEVIRRKTAYLFSACAEVGGILAGVSRAEQEALRDYGMNIGTAFQMVDDILDFTASEAKLGKPVGGDLRDGKVTLPLIRALACSDGNARQLVETVIREAEFHSVPFSAIRELIETSHSLADARDEAERYARRARQNLQVFPATSYREALMDITHFIVSREN